MKTVDRKLIGILQQYLYNNPSENFMKGIIRLGILSGILNGKSSEEMCELPLPKVRGFLLQRQDLLQGFP